MKDSARGVIRVRSDQKLTSPRPFDSPRPSGSESDNEDLYQSNVDIYEEFASVPNPWRKILRRVTKFSRQFSRVIFALLIVNCIVIFLVWAHPYAKSKGLTVKGAKQNYKYVTVPSTSVKSYPLAIIADLDKRSRVEGTTARRWRSILKKGELRKHPSGQFTMHWLEDQEVFGSFEEAGRGMELSELLDYRGKLYGFDDRTGIVYELVKGNRAIPRHILMEGDGNTDKGMKIEWATVKDGKMYVGSYGKEFLDDDGRILHSNNKWVVVIDEKGRVTHEDWTKRYQKLQAAVGVPFPGYMIHEAVNWSEERRQWVFLPRRVSQDGYDEGRDEFRGSNKVIFANERFTSVTVKEITPLTPTRGFSTFKFLPNSGDQVVVAIKSEEHEASQTQNSFVTVFTLDGEVLLPETPIPGNVKFEGLEFFV